MIQRAIEKYLVQDITEGKKVVIVYGARQVGKTTLVRKVIGDLRYRKLEVNADLLAYQDVLSSRDLRKMKELIGNNELLFIDEAQNIRDIGINLKILHDHLPHLRIIATGSSSFELANQVQEPLTGRTWTHRLYPIAVKELLLDHTPFEVKQSLESYLLYGMYPDVLLADGAEQKVRILQELASSYLYKDILQLTNIKHSDKLVRLLKLLAFQAGSLVSIHELAKSLELSHETINNYIDLLEKGFIIFRLGGFSRNLRKEVSKMNKIYFYDNGIRNMLIDNFNPLDLRQDTGALWENFLVSERVKKKSYDRIYGDSWFWRTYSGAEVDYLEERDGKLHGFEFKWKASRAKAPKSWLETYQEAQWQLINRENFIEFVS